MFLDHSGIDPELNALYTFAKLFSVPDLAHLLKCGVLI